MKTLKNTSLPKNLPVALPLFASLILLPSPALAKAPTAKTLLWEISGNGLSQNSYLFGTIHRGCAKQLTLSAEQEKALIKSKQLYTEVTYASKGSSAVPSRIENKNRAAANHKKLREIMTPEQYSVVEDYFGKDFLEFIIRNKTPLDAANDLDLRIQQEAAGKFYQKRCKEVTSKENVLVAFAKKHGIKLAGIETEEDRSNTFQNTQAQDTLNSLLDRIKEYQESPETVEESFAEGQNLYLSQDINGIHLRDNGGDSIYRALIEDRNRLWIPRMLNAMKQKSTFFAFGAAHLGGSNGVISLLKAQGYRLRPIFDRPIANPLASHPRSAQAAMKAEDYFKTGQIRAKENETLEAIDNYSQAIALNPQYAEAYEQRAFLKRNNLNDFRGALADLNRAIAINPQNTNFYFSRASLQETNLKDFRGALNDLNRILELDPNNSSAYINRGILQNEKLHNPQSALLDFNIHLRLTPQSIDGHIVRGILKYTNLKDRDGGIADIHRAIKLARIQRNSNALGKAQAILVTMSANP